jgi:hypothetical protein
LDNLKGSQRANLVPSTARLAPHTGNFPGDEVSLRPWRNAPKRAANAEEDPLPKIPTTGTAGCCARIASSFDHLVGAGDERWRHREAERLGCLEVDHEVKFRGLLDR